MTASSRRTLLPATSAKTISGWWFLVLFAALLGALCIHKTGQTFAIILFILAILVWGASIIQKRRLQRIAKQRLEDSICTFARSFDCRIVDTRIIRATYEELQKYYARGVQNFPFNAADSFEKILNTDDEDLYDIATEVARRAQRSLDDTKQNPLYGKVKTVGDLVLFLNHQPLQSKPSV